MDATLSFTPNSSIEGPVKAETGGESGASTPSLPAISENFKKFQKKLPQGVDIP
jgi:hypothetical protein